jgi:hypothetical protein
MPAFDYISKSAMPEIPMLSFAGLELNDYLAIPVSAVFHTGKDGLHRYHRGSAFSSCRPEFI